MEAEPVGFLGYELSPGRECDMNSLLKTVTTPVVNFSESVVRKVC